ncbi:MAG: polysaccharide pyruvyl transferase family protein, partial [Acutalibacteraceae bacterium]
DYLRHYKLTGVGNPAYDKPILREAYQLLKLPGRLKARRGKRKMEFDAFTEKYLPVSEKEYISNDELKSASVSADVFFAGSDQIWNTFFPNGKDPAFYLDFVSDCAVKASYAASFATEKILDGYEEKIKSWLSDMDFISVRESSGLSILESLGIKNAVTVTDPVFLLDREKWESLADDESFSEPYILVYDFDKSLSVEAFAKRYAEENKVKIYSFLSVPYCDRSFEQEGPLVFLSLIKNADFVISNSFHATAFSLIFEKQFAVFRRQESINTRMADLLSSVGLSERMLVSGDEECDEIRFDGVRNSLKEKIAESKKYIDTVLSAVKK